MTSSQRTRPRLPLNLRALPQAPEAYNREDQHALRSALEAAFVETEAIRSVIYEFSALNQQIDVALPFACKAIGWRARLDASGDATFDVFYAPDELTGLSSVGGTSPVIAGAYGASSHALDWTTVYFAAGSILSVLLSDLVTGARATLSIEVMPK